jgi:glutamate-1-semialdehyde aminotransferase
LLMKNGIFTHPSQSEHMFVSTVHTDQDIETARIAATEALTQLK